MYKHLARLGVAIFLLTVSVSSADATVFTIQFKLNNASSYDALDFYINDSAANGAFVGAGDQVQCTTNASLNATAAYNYVDPNLYAGIIRSPAFSGAVVLMTCNFNAVSGTPTANQFAITVREWSPAASPSPTIIVSQIQ